MVRPQTQAVAPNSSQWIACSAVDPLRRRSFIDVRLTSWIEPSPYNQLIWGHRGQSPDFAANGVVAILPKTFPSSRELKRGGQTAAEGRSRGRERGEESGEEMTWWQWLTIMIPLCLSTYGIAKTEDLLSRILKRVGHVAEKAGENG